MWQSPLATPEAEAVKKVASFRRAGGSLNRAPFEGDELGVATALTLDLSGLAAKEFKSFADSSYR